ncbi:hypothetical protein Drose_26090 [Dactylosporangium roseum]|uniref:Uncharacterized protein n=1 Tax=Dactylosporangium roseum TaxID=47989 RepID=A0ABY5YY44_9ACTN|nr:hypothetical protein [Dactylosporangium roseum]UWZ34675.1 hypothetical protein Drose_26090 [Dactylosporangium roseum]
MAGAAFGDAGQQQGQPADEHVRADAVFEAVEDRPEQQLGLEIAEAAFGLEEVLVAQRDVPGADARVGGGDEVLAVQPGLGLDFARVDAQPAVGNYPYPYTYTYDNADNTTGTSDAPAGQTSDQCFTYDYLRRLTQAWTPASGVCAAAPTIAGLGGPAPYWQSKRTQY